ncbi:MAG: DUF5675 family protein [Prevotella sp.]|jgi:hypothetical protein|nr:DUF5675 family protein [Prevotella sp.]
MELLLKRKFKGEKYTVGNLYIDGEFFCHTIEDKVRELPEKCPDTPKRLVCKCKEKIYNKTAIPAGRYKVTLEESPRFKRILPIIHNVPHFLGILIHTGNTEEHSSGCIIVGKNTVKGKVLYSKVTMAALMERLEKTDNITITIE